MKRVAITGSAGYLGGRIVTVLRELEMSILGIDVQSPAETAETDEFAELDICDDRLLSVLADFQPDTIIHSAFVVRPIRDKREMRRVNIDGTRHLLKCAEEIRPQRLMVISSATAYGAWPDNPIPLNEDWPLRPREGFPYAANKTEMEEMVQSFADRYSDIAVSWVRPAIIGGPCMNNYLRRILFSMPILIKLDGYDQPMQLVHERDVVGAIRAILDANGRGAYNVAPPDWKPLSEIARETGRRAIRLPFWLVYFVHRLAWTLGLPYPETRADFLYFARFPWVVQPKRLQEELGFAFQYSTTETMQEVLEAWSSKSG